ncbi:MAG: SRPBCC domain-containing protein [Actinomycetota bacterium]
MSTRPFPTLRTETVVGAPPERVWDVLADFEGWDGWNPTLFGADGPPRAGAEVRMTLRMGRLKVPMRQQVRIVDPPRQLTWRSRQMVPASLFDVLRSFLLEPVGEDQTRLVQTETATGLLARPVMAVIGRSVRRGYDDLAEALARRLRPGAGA